MNTVKYFNILLIFIICFKNYFELKNNVFILLINVIYFLMVSRYILNYLIITIYTNKLPI